MKSGLLILTMIGTITMCYPVQAEPLTDLLEQATHQEESVGDLSAAIDLYSQVIDQNQGNQQLVAQALYRRALCYHKLGRAVEAQFSLNQILDQYPDQKATVQLAKRTLKELFGPQSTLLPAPWENNELLRYELISEGGSTLGEIQMEAQRIETKTEMQWRLDAYLSIPISQTFQFSRVEADIESFTTTKSYVTNAQLGKLEAEFSDNQITTVSTRGEAHGNAIENQVPVEKTIELSTRVYDYEQGIHLARRLPLHRQYVASIPLYYALTNSIVDATIKVVGEEQVTAPIGTFNTYKVIASFNNNVAVPTTTFWVSQDDNKQIIKFKSQGNTAILTEVSRIPDTVTTVEDKKTKIEFEVPRSWRVMNATDVGNQFAAFYNIFAPKMDGVAMLAVREIDTRSSNISLPLIVENDISILKGYFKNYTVWEDSYSDFVVNGAPARSYIADFSFQEMSQVEHRTYIQGPQGIYWFILRTDKTNVESLKNDYEALYSSLVTPLPDTPNKACTNEKNSNLLTNGDFSEGKSHWIAYLHDDLPGANITFDETNEYAQINVRDGGKADWHVQIVQEGLCLEYTKKYRLSFDYAMLSNGEENTFSPSVQRTGNGYTDYIFPNKIDATTGIQHYEHDFMMSAETDTNARVLFNFGGVKIDSDLPESQFTIDNVKLIEL